MISVQGSPNVIRVDTFNMSYHGCLYRSTPYVWKGTELVGRYANGAPSIFNSDHFPLEAWERQQQGVRPKRILRSASGYHIQVGERSFLFPYGAVVVAR